MPVPWHRGEHPRKPLPVCAAASTAGLRLRGPRPREEFTNGHSQRHRTPRYVRIRRTAPLPRRSEPRQLRERSPPGLHLDARVTPRTCRREHHTPHALTCISSPLDTTTPPAAVSEASFVRRTPHCCT
jgi:hypothetical protein